LTEAQRRILVVEDDPKTVIRLVDFLRTSGYEVDLGRNGKRTSAEFIAAKR
jgi:DNA-binding response OmpR family regulator